MNNIPLKIILDLSINLLYIWTWDQGFDVRTKMHMVRIRECKVSRMELFQTGIMTSETVNMES